MVETHSFLFATVGYHIAWGDYGQFVDDVEGMYRT